MLGQATGSRSRGRSTRGGALWDWDPFSEIFCVLLPVAARCLRVPGANGCQASQGRGVRFAELSKVLECVCHGGLCERVRYAAAISVKPRKCQVPCSVESPLQTSPRDLRPSSSVPWLGQLHFAFSCAVWARLARHRRCTSDAATGQRCGVAVPLPWDLSRVSCSLWCQNMGGCTRSPELNRTASDRQLALRHVGGHAVSMVR